MNNNTSTARVQNRPPRRESTRGVALIFTLLVLSLMMVLSIGMVIALSSQTFISGYYRNFRGAFYAADSGVNLTRVAMMNTVSARVPATVNLGQAPLSTVVGSTNPDATAVLSAISTYGSWTSLNGGQATGSWPGKFELNSSVPATFAFANCHLSYNWASTTGVQDPNTVGVPTPPAYTCTAPPPSAKLCSTAAALTNNCYVINNFQYTYTYTIDGLGQVQNSEQAEIVDSGNVVITVNISQPSGVTKNQSFAAWGMFIDKSPICNGSTLVNGTLTGPVFTNGAWNFNTGSYIFTDSVGQAGAQAGANFSSGCNPTSTLPSTSSGQTVNPTFNNQFQIGQTAVTPPGNSYNQEWAALDGIGTTPTTPAATDLAARVKGANGNAFVSGASSGVYMPWAAPTGSLNLPPNVLPPLGVPGGAGATQGAATCTPVTAPVAPVKAGPNGCISGGGIYVKGNATVTLQASVVGGNPVQIFTIVNNGATTTITVDPVGQITTFVTGGNTQVLTGVPSNLNCNPPTEAVMVYVDGNITSLAGAGTASIQDNSAVTVTANGDMTVTGNITYKTEPVTTTQNQIPGTPADTLITLPAGSSQQVLGLFTANGNVNLAVGSSGQNLEIDASIAAIGGAGTGGLVNTGNSINTLNIVGGRIQSTIQNIGATTRNVFFDRRFAQGNFAPPWFPSTSITSTPTGIENSTVGTPNAQRIEWRCKSCQ